MTTEYNKLRELAEDAVRRLWADAEGYGEGFEKFVKDNPEAAAHQAINAIWPEVEELLTELARHHRDFERIGTIVDEYEKNYGPIFKLLRDIRNVIG